jgi:hypothetical protein
MIDSKLVDEARAFVTVIGSGRSELSYEQIRLAFLRLVPDLIAEVEIMSAIQMSLPVPKKPRLRSAPKKKRAARKTTKRKAAKRKTKK